MKEFFKIDLSHFSIFSLIYLGFAGVFLYAILWITRNYLVLFLIKSPIRRKKILNKLPAIFSLLWIIFSIYSLYVIIKPFPFLGVILTLVFVYLGRGYLMNLVHGVFFRLKGDIAKGQKIAIDSYSGEVESVNIFDVEIQNKQGEIIQIPYSNIARKEIVKKDFSADFSSYKFSIIVSDKITENVIKNRLLQLPWVATVFKPKVTKGFQSEDKISYDIIVYTLDEKYNYYVENSLLNSFSQTQKLQ